MSKIIKKSDIIKITENTMKRAGLMKENETLEEKYPHMDEDNSKYYKKDLDPSHPLYHASDEELDNVKQAMEMGKKEEIEENEMDVVEESVNKLSKSASKPNVITENLKGDLDKFNKIINYKYH